MWVISGINEQLVGVMSLWVISGVNEQLVGGNELVGH